MVGRAGQLHGLTQPLQGTRAQLSLGRRGSCSKNGHHHIFNEALDLFVRDMFYPQRRGHQEVLLDIHLEAKEKRSETGTSRFVVLKTLRLSMCLRIG